MVSCWLSGLIFFSVTPVIEHVILSNFFLCHFYSSSVQGQETVGYSDQNGKDYIKINTSISFIINVEYENVSCNLMRFI